MHIAPLQPMELFLLSLSSRPSAFHVHADAALKLLRRRKARNAHSANKDVRCSVDYLAGGKDGHAGGEANVLFEGRARGIINDVLTERPYSASPRSYLESLSECSTTWDSSCEGTPNSINSKSTDDSIESSSDDSGPQNLPKAQSAHYGQQVPIVPSMMRRRHEFHESCQRSSSFACVLGDFGLMELTSSWPTKPVAPRDVDVACSLPVGFGGELELIGAGHSIPHPEKASASGADSFFIGANCRSIGIADGVGEWEWRFGVNARAFADELMAGCKESLEGSGADPSDMVLQALRDGWKSTRSFGSSTALVTAIDRTGKVAVANIGDSSLLLLRSAGVGMRCIERTKEQQHAFNCPYQLSLLPGIEDVPKLLDEGKEKLARAVQRMQNRPKVDSPEDADIYSFTAQEGDLLILGTDGLFDNLYVHEICELAARAVAPLKAPYTKPEKLAEALCKAALHRSKDRSARSPFGDHARQAGLYHTGGKMDDITCVCAWISSKQK